MFVAYTVIYIGSPLFILAYGCFVFMPRIFYLCCLSVFVKDILLLLSLIFGLFLRILNFYCLSFCLKLRNFYFYC